MSMSTEEAVAHLYGQAESYSRDSATFRAIMAAGSASPSDAVWSAAYFVISLALRKVADEVRRGALEEISRPVLQAEPIPT